MKDWTPDQWLIRGALFIAVMIALLFITGCGVESTAGESADRRAFNAVWSDTTEHDKDVMCWGVRVMGEDYVASQMDTVDHPEIIARLFTEKCNEEGR